MQYLGRPSAIVGASVVSNRRAPVLSRRYRFSTPGVAPGRSGGLDCATAAVERSEENPRRGSRNSIPRLGGVMFSVSQPEAVRRERYWLVEPAPLGSPKAAKEG